MTEWFSGGSGLAACKVFSQNRDGRMAEWRAFKHAHILRIFVDEIRVCLGVLSGLLKL